MGSIGIAVQSGSAVRACHCGSFQSFSRHAPATRSSRRWHFSEPGLYWPFQSAPERARHHYRRRVGGHGGSLCCSYRLSWSPSLGSRVGVRRRGHKASVERRAAAFAGCSVVREGRRGR